MRLAEKYFHLKSNAVYNSSAKNKASRIEEYPNSMSTAHLFYNEKKGHKMPFLVNNIYCGAAVASRLVKWIHLD